jgi:hypothetical protein
MAKGTQAMFQGAQAISSSRMATGAHNAKTAGKERVISGRSGTVRNVCPYETVQATASGTVIKGAMTSLMSALLSGKRLRIGKYKTFQELCPSVLSGDAHIV